MTALLLRLSSEAQQGEDDHDTEKSLDAQDGGGAFLNFDNRNKSSVTVTVALRLWNSIIHDQIIRDSDRDRDTETLDRDRDTETWELPGIANGSIHIYLAF